MEPVSTPQILVVDDNPSQLTALRAILDGLGANVQCVGSGRDALRCLLHQDFASILLDVNMPTMDGFETAALIRERPRSEHTPIIFITASVDETHIARGYSLGAVDYINTPVVPEVLRAKVSVFIELFRTSAEVRRQAESLRRRAEQLHGLTAASLAIHETTSIERMLPVVAEQARAILGTPFAAARIRHEQGRVSLGESRAAGRVDDAVGLLDAARERVGTARAPIRFMAVERDGVPEIALAVPLIGGDERLVGVLLATGKSDGEFTADDEAVIQQLGQMASLAAENTRYQEEREANRLKDEFLATVSHELRTPLTAMLSWVRLLQDGRLAPPERVRALEIIDRNARGQARLIDDLLDTSRIVTGKLAIGRDTVALERVVVDAVEAVRPEAEAKGVEIGLVLATDLAVTGDARRLQQVLGNLLGNAVKFTPRGGRIAVTLGREGGHAEMRVADTGPGIDPEFLPHIFDRFRQADTSMTRTHGGLGLGLAIVRHLVELHGGTAFAESGEGSSGAIFVIRLPLAADEPARAAELATPVAREPGDSISLTGLRILLVEDDRDSRDAIATLLMTAAADVVAVGSVRAALSAIADEPPDLVLTDIGLPEEDGFALIQSMRERGGDVPAIALTAYTRPEDRARAMGAGFSAHVGKPIDATELFSAIESCTVPARARRRAL
ncbi:MAG TPA: response regulator [Candidatus Binatia bacterium]|jgi:signal transduction histidine kinase